MNDSRQKVFSYLDQLGVAYEVTEHPAVYTIEEMDAVETLAKGEGWGVAKNLFVRDDKHRRYFVIVLQKDKRANLKDIRRQIGCKPLTFASEEDLASYLGLTKGAVSPLGVLNDEACTVEVALDTDLLALEKVGVHPNENTATVWLSPKDLEAVVTKHGTGVCHITV